MMNAAIFMLKLMNSEMFIKVYVTHNNIKRGEVDIEGNYNESKHKEEVTYRYLIRLRYTQYSHRG